MPRVAIINLIIFLILVLIIWFGAWPGFQKMRVLNGAVDDINMKIAEEKQAIEEIKSLARSVDAKKDELEKVRIAIPPQRDTASIIAILEEAANTNGLALSSIEILDPIDQGSSRGGEGQSKNTILNSFTVRSSLTGRYASFRSFLKDIEASFPLMDTSEVLFQTPKNQDLDNIDLKDPLFDLTLSFETYYTKE